MQTTFKLKMNAPYLYLRLTFITGRNEVVAKVMFYRCVSVHRGGGCLPQCMLGCQTPRISQTPPPRPGRPPGPARPPQARQTPPLDQADPPGKQTPAYSLRAAGTHPTGMHSCSLCNDNSKQPRKTPYNIVLTLHKKCSN